MASNLKGKKKKKKNIHYTEHVHWHLEAFPAGMFRTEVWVEGLRLYINK